MKATELRIGNLVRSQNTPIPCRVVTLHKHVAAVIENTINSFEETCNYVDFSAIPLTEEWLERFGFELLNKSVEYWGKNGFCFTWMKDNIDKSDCLYLFLDGLPVNKRPEIKHVHTLQNLYFALTGKELELVK